MNIGQSEYHDAWMPWRLAEIVLPDGDKKNFDAWTRQGFVPAQQGGVSSTGSGRGKARTYSLASCVGLATLWELTRLGYKPSACVNIVDFVIAKGEEVAAHIDDGVRFEDPMIFFYQRLEKSVDVDPSTVRGIMADRALVAEWIARPGSKEARPLARTIESQTGTASGSISGFFFFEGGNVIQRIIDQYLELKEAHKPKESPMYRYRLKYLAEQDDGNSKTYQSDAPVAVGDVIKPSHGDYHYVVRIRPLDKDICLDLSKSATNIEDALLLAKQHGHYAKR